MNFQELMKKMAQLDQPVQEEKKADKDYDGDGEVESPKDEVWGSRMKAAEKSKEEKVDEDLEDDIEECGMTPGMMPSTMMPPPKQQDSVTMNVSMNGSGPGGIKDLMNILRNIESKGSTDMPDIDDGPDLVMKKEPMIGDEFENEPEEKYADIPAVINTGSDLHSKGIEAPKANGGGNPQQLLQQRLENLYNDIKQRDHLQEVSGELAKKVSNARQAQANKTNSPEDKKKAFKAHSKWVTRMAKDAYRGKSAAEINKGFASDADSNYKKGWSND